MKLSPSMTLAQFDNGYWYATELKAFGDRIGIPAAGKLRKDELEKAIKEFLRTGKAALPTRRSLDRSGVKDVDKGLTLDLRIVNYTSNKTTKDFIVREAQEMAPGLRRRQGARYRLNRWREEQLMNGRRITYRDLVRQYVELNQSEVPFARVPHGRYIKFLADFLKAEEGATHAQGRKAWERLKRTDIPRTYAAWIEDEKARRKLR